MPDSDLRLSPIARPPLPLPGAALRARMERLLDEEITPYVAMLFVAVLMAVREWAHALGVLAPHPRLATLGVVVVAGLFWRCFVRVRGEYRQLRLGESGERAVGQHLERLRASGYEVFHDIPAGTFNLDHVVIGPCGIFAIEDKTWSKTKGRDERIRYCERNQTVQIGDRFVTGDPVQQARAQADYLRDLIAKLDGRPHPVRAVLVFPGWYVASEPPPWKCEIWVVGHGALTTLLTNGQQREVLSPADVSRLAHHLEQHVRNQMAAKT